MTKIRKISAHRRFANPHHRAERRESEPAEGGRDTVEQALSNQQSAFTQPPTQDEEDLVADPEGAREHIYRKAA